jgi:hypothetical protein
MMLVTPYQWREPCERGQVYGADPVHSIRKTLIAVSAPFLQCILHRVAHLRDMCESNGGCRSVMSRLHALERFTRAGTSDETAQAGVVAGRTHGAACDVVMAVTGKHLSG